MYLVHSCLRVVCVCVCVCVSQVESDYYDKQQQRCQAEKMSRHRMWAYGKREEVRTHCSQCLL